MVFEISWVSKNEIKFFRIHFPWFTLVQGMLYARFHSHPYNEWLSFTHNILSLTPILFYFADKKRWFVFDWIQNFELFDGLWTAFVTNWIHASERNAKWIGPSSLYGFNAWIKCIPIEWNLPIDTMCTVSRGNSITWHMFL